MKRISSHAVILCLFGSLALAVAHWASNSKVQAQPPGACTPVARAWYQGPTSLGANSILLVDQDSLKRNRNDIHLTNVTGHSQNTLHSLAGTSINDRMTSLAWNLPPGVIVVLYEHPQPTRPGRQYVIWGNGQDLSVKEDAFNDKISAWAWFCVR